MTTSASRSGTSPPQPNPGNHGPSATAGGGAGAHPYRPPLPATAVVFGEALVDFFPTATDLGKPLEEAEGFTRHLGGAPCNLAVGLARQGIPTALCTLVGGDAFGRFVVRALTDEGIACDAIGSHPTTRTGVTFVAVQPGGRSFLFYRHPSADMMIAPGHVDERAAHLRRGRLFHFGSSTLSREPCRAATLRALALATGSAAPSQAPTGKPIGKPAALAGPAVPERSRRLITCDVNLRPHLWPDIKEAPPLLRKVLADCDVVKLVPEELPILYGTESVEEAADKARKAGATIVAVTLGDSGCYIDSPAGQTYVAAESVKAIDATGAGDAFTAGLLASLLHELAVRDPEDPMASDDLRSRLRSLSAAQIKRAAIHANHLGALACTAIGATTALPRQPAPAGRVR